MIILIVLLVVLDLTSKLLIKHFLAYNSSIIVIRDFFKITYVKNTGAAWSLFNNNQILVLIISGAIICYLGYYIYKSKITNKIEISFYSLIMAGAIGNFINRVVFGYVIDFIDIKIFGYNYPIFNIADIFIVVGVIGLIIYTWGCHKNDIRSK